MKHLPNIITGLRVLFVPLTWIFFLQQPFDWNHNIFLGYPAPFWVVLLVILSGASDTADGVIARRSQSQSAFGKIMDPVADKIFITTCWILLMHIGRLHPIWVIIALSRDAFIGALRNLAGVEGKVIAASSSAKTKTVIQFISVGCLAHADYFWFAPWLPLFLIGQITFFVALALSYYSLVTYMIDFGHRQKT